jgi:hypothetical protein
MKNVFPVLFAAFTLMFLCMGEYWAASATGVLACAAWISESGLAADKIQRDKDDRARVEQLAKDPRAAYLGICTFCNQKGYGPSRAGKWIVCTECLGNN